MLRKLLLLIVLAIVVFIGLVATGFVNLMQRSDGSVEINTRDPVVGTRSTNVQMPVVRIENRKVALPTVGVEGEPTNTQ